MVGGMSLSEDVATSRLLVVDRVALLRRASLFAATPGRVLAGLAQVLDEVSFAAGDTIIAEGAVEDWLFILLSGTVEVRRADGHVRLGAIDVIGELAVLDPEPRVATVVALTDVTTFRLDKRNFDEALRTRPEIAAGVITALVRRLRERRD